MKYTHITQYGVYIIIFVSFSQHKISQTTSRFAIWHNNMCCFTAIWKNTIMQWRKFFAFMVFWQLHLTSTVFSLAFCCQFAWLVWTITHFSDSVYVDYEPFHRGLYRIITYSWVFFFICLYMYMRHM